MCPSTGLVRWCISPGFRGRGVFFSASVAVVYFLRHPWCIYPSAVVYFPCGRGVFPLPAWWETPTLSTYRWIAEITGCIAVARTGRSLPRSVFAGARLAPFASIYSVSAAGRRVCPCVFAHGYPGSRTGVCLLVCQQAGRCRCLVSTTVFNPPAFCKCL